MSRVASLPRAFLRAHLVGTGSTRKEILRQASSQGSQPASSDGSTDDSAHITPGIKGGNTADVGVTIEGDVVYEQKEDPDEYKFTSEQTPSLTDRDKTYLDRFRPKVDPRLSKVFRGYTSLDENGWTITYSKMGWYSMKQIYGHYDDNDERSVYYIHPRSTLMRLLRDPIVLRSETFDYWREKREVDAYKNFQTVELEKLHTMGPELYAANFVCRMGGKVKFHAFKNWFDKSNWKSLPQVFAKEFVCEAIDLSNTPLFYEGMTFLMRLSDLRSLNLSNCTALDEWAINRLHPLRTTLVHLDLSGCHGMSDRGLVTLWKMKNLRRLILSGLEDSVNNLPLIAMELEEALPECYIHGVDFERSPNPKASGIPADYDPETTALMEKYGNDVVNIDYEKWWGLNDQDFDHEKFKYSWRGRPFRNDWEDWVEDFKSESGWLWRVLNYNPFAPVTEPPKRRV